MVVSISEYSARRPVLCEARPARVVNRTGDMARLKPEGGLPGFRPRVGSVPLRRPPSPARRRSRGPSHQPICRMRLRMTELYSCMHSGFRRRGAGRMAARRAACSRSNRAALTP